MKRLLAFLLLASEAFAACSATAPNKGAGTTVTALTSSVTITIANTTDLVVVSVWCVSACTVSSVQDGGSRAYTKSTNSPGTAGTGTGIPAIYFRLSAGTSGSTTITTTLSGSVQQQTGAIDFALGTGCTATFDKDAGATAAGVTTIVTPAITPTNSGEVLYHFAAVSTGTTSASSPWTAGTIPYSTTTNGDAYILSSTNTSTAPNMAMTSGNHSSLVAAFVLTASGATPAFSKRQKLQKFGVS